ncbi:MAG: helix-turn-helix transcriptional regulator [Rhodoferax sp.]|nr:helix-turn-helix transcriptional regulator [Rhodoferax sp.]
MNLSAINGFGGQIEDMALADRIKHAMEESGLRKTELANACGVSAASVTHWLNGNTKKLKAENASAIAKATGFNSDWLTNGKGPRKPGALTVKPQAAAPTGRTYSDLGHRLASLFDMLPADPQLQAKAFGVCTQAIFTLEREYAEQAIAAQTVAEKAKSPS